MDQNSPIRFRASRYIGTYLSVVLIIVVFGTGIMVGQFFNFKKASPLAQAYGTSDATDTAAIVGIDRSIDHSKQVSFDEFWQVWDTIHSKYVKQPVQDSDLFYGSIEGMVAGLGDPYSVYFPPTAASEFEKSLSGQLNGIGAEIGIKNNDLVVIAPLPGTPAAEAGLRPGDHIVAIDGLSTLGMDVDTAVADIRGPATSSVKLTIMRDGWEKAKDISIHRAAINVPSVLFSMKSGNVAYIQVLQFNQDTVSQFNTAVAQLKADHAKSIILDLRDNPGGLLDAAIAMASEWIPQGEIVSERFNSGQETNHETEGQHRLVGIPTVVLVNGGSASAAEIVSGALQDHKAATVVGEQTFGKGSVQDFEQFPDGSALKVTVAEWYTPNGHNINKKGITPDVSVKEDFNKEKVGQDVMIDKAYQLFGIPTSTLSSAGSGK